MGQKTHEKTQKFSPGSGTENSIYSFGNEVRDDFFFPPGPELKTVFIALEMKFAMTESHFLFFSPGPRTGNSIYNFGNKFAMYSLGNVTLSSRTSFPKL